MSEKTLKRLVLWRAREAARQSVAERSILSDEVLAALAADPFLSRTDLVRLAGPHAATVAAMLDDSPSAERTAGPETLANPNSVSGAPYSVSAFLDLLKDSLSGLRVRVEGEVSSVEMREKVVYFTLKDERDGSALPCLMFRYLYQMAGVRLEAGQRVIVSGSPDIWKPMGKLSLKAEMVELAGEGALKQAYDTLYRTLESEGLFAPARKRPLPVFPERVALITSRDGAAIGDFMTNLGRHGFRVTLRHSGVEGARAVTELLEAVRYFDERSGAFDLLVIIRGGGSLESLQAFNNENLVRAVAACRLPVVAGIGHEKDVSLVALVADAMVSTPTAAARIVASSWDEAGESLRKSEQALVVSLRRLEQGVFGIEARFAAAVGGFGQRLQTVRRAIDGYIGRLPDAAARLLAGVESRLAMYERTLAAQHPDRLLRLGYAIATSRGRVVRSVTDLLVGDRMTLRLADGAAETTVEKLEKKKAAR